MQKRMKKWISWAAAAACVVTSVSAGGTGSTVRADELDVSAGYTPLAEERYELEDGRTFEGEGAAKDVTIKNGSQFSGGAAVDTMDKNGDGAGVEIEPVITEEGLYQVTLGYTKGVAREEGKIALYKNDERVDYFYTKNSNNQLVEANTIAVRLEEGDKLSLISDTGDTMDAVACFDYLDVGLWGGQYEAETSELLGGTRIRDLAIASGGQVVQGFQGPEGVIEGAGVAFPFVIPEDDTYILTLGYNRLNYEIADQIGLYVNDERVADVELISKGNTDEVITDSDPVEIALKKDDKISVKTEGEDKGLLELDWIRIQPKTAKVDDGTEAGFENGLFRVVSGDVLTIPLRNVPEGTELTYTSSDPDVASVDAQTGQITAGTAGDAVITAQGGGYSFSVKVQVVDSEDQLPVETAKYEAEEGTLIAGDKAEPVIKEGSPFSGNKWVEIYDAGTGAGVEITPDISEKGDYVLTMAYGKGSMYPDDRVSVYVNNKKVGEFKLINNHLTEVWDTNSIVAELEPGDKVTVRKDSGMNSLFRYDYLKVAPDATIPAREITINTKEMEVIEMETVEADYTLSPEYANGNVVWTSGDPDIAEADGGVIRGRGTGTTTVTATSLYNDSITDSMTVTVTQNDKLESIASDEMTVLIDREFPRVMEYRMKSGNSMDGNTTAFDTMVINGKEYKPEVTYEKKDSSTAVYTLTVSELDAVLTLQMKVEGTILKMDFTDIKESEDKDKRIYTFDIPQMNPVSVSSREETAEFAGSKMVADIRKTGDTYIDLTRGEASAAAGYNYAFISNGKVSAGIRSNAYTESDSNSRVIMETVEGGSAYRTNLRSNSWLWRRADYTKKFKDYEGKYTEAGEVTTQTYEDTPNTSEMPLCYIVLAEDLNNTGTVDWQDAAIRYRDVAQYAMGQEKIADAVVQRLIMPQAGEGNYPFVSSLDETKRVYLNTDGLGQIILNKYHNLGYWGDFSVYDDHLGGLVDFNKFVSDSTNKYNSYVGVHTNFTQAFAKTNQFSTESIAMNEDGLTPKTAGYAAYGFFLHQSYTTDDTWEALSGERRDAMALFKSDVPDLGFIYSDVYSYGGWRGERLADDYEANGLGYFVEWPYVCEDRAVWAHWAVEKDYSPASNKGYASDIARFIFNHEKDRWDNNASKCDNERYPNSCNLLMGADTTSYEGWVHDGVNQYDYIIEKVFDNNLPTKYMQHFPIIRMDKDSEGWGEHIWFEDGLEVYRDADGRRVMEKDGKLVYTEDAYLIPWDEGDMQTVNSDEDKEVKLYHWNENGGTTTWELPDSWSGLGTVYLYKLTDLGKTDEQVISVNNGTIALSNIEAKTPYVIYKGEAAPTEDVNYGDGTFVKDPGFNYGDLREWTVVSGNPEVRKNDNEGDLQSTINKYDGNLRNYELIIPDSQETEVTQTVTGLNGGEEYAASVMVEVEQGKERMASIKVDCGGETVENYTTKSILEQYDAYDSKAGTYMLRMRVVFKVPEGEDSATIRLCAAEGEGKVRFDNVRVYDTAAPEAPEDAENVVLYQDFEYAKRTDAPERAENKATYESYYPFNLGSAGGIREARAMLQSRHDPYTQNNANYEWDPKTIFVDMALEGDHSLSIITDSLGRAFQTTPQTVRFEEGHTYRISFIYQNALDDTFAFVLGADQNADLIYQESLKATPAGTGSREFTYEFTCGSDQTWFGFDRVNRDVTVTDNPNPLVLDNILVEDLTEETEPGIDKTALEVLYDQYKDLEKTGYTKETWEAFAEALKAAEKVLNDEGADQEQIDAAKEELQAAADGLRVSRTNLEYWLNSAKAHVENGDTAGLVESVRQLFDEAIAQGDAVMAMENPSLDEVTNATLKLMLAVHSLDMKAGDKTDLEMALELAGMIDLDKYTEDGQEAFQAAKEAAEAVAADGDAMQADIDSAWSDLADAMSALRLKADKAALEDLLDSVAGLDLSQYTDESVQVFKAAFAAANAMLEDQTLSTEDQKAVDSAVQELTAARDGLVLKDGETGSDGQDPDADAGSNGGASQDPAGGSGADSSEGSADSGNSAAGTQTAAKTGDTAPAVPVLAAVLLAAAFIGGTAAVRRKHR